jgi:hypothetical protein
MLSHTMVFNTVSELYDFLENHNVDTLVNRAAFGLDLLDRVRDNDNVFTIDRPVDDGCWIEVDDDGYVVKDFL